MVVGNPAHAEKHAAPTTLWAHLEEIVLSPDGYGNEAIYFFIVVRGLKRVF